MPVDHGGIWWGEWVDGQGAPLNAGILIRIGERLMDLRLLGELRKRLSLSAKSLDVLIFLDLLRLRFLL